MQEPFPEICGEALIGETPGCCRPKGHEGLHVPITHQEAPDYVRREWTVKYDDWPCPVHNVDQVRPECPACCLAVAEGLSRVLG